jgi:O-methyltransferase involved in polyketide biosynthesis
MVNVEKVTFTGAQETTLATLYGKAMESRQPNSVLGDRLAYQALQRIDYDFTKLRMSRRDQQSAAVRAKAYDGWVQRFLDRYPSARCCIWAAVWIPASTGSTRPPLPVGMTSTCLA